MEKQPYSKFFLALIAITGWFALIAQFYIYVTTKSVTLQEMIIRYFSYFTIQTNLLVAICCTMLVVSPGSKWGRFFSIQQTFAAITVYIVIVGLIYNTILRFLWNPQGLQNLVDELLHSVIPILVLLYWFLFAGKNQLQWNNVLKWLIYPFAYIIYILIRGVFSGFYPYPFINTEHLGLNRVLVNSVGIALVFTVISLLLVFIAKSMSKSTANTIFES